ncbi:hypothetical protein OWR29_25945 [Actinoplanes sp. Pm04-4]|uniref:Uncharacterized protein n=1 Tax=Paractinoplanes pyxinae TaxID=2997416 RepID=A0ABT4B4N0_9ACTN|nr:hypothetical protein [Actinoplanes pyxinae]MCY1141454.1 hypothetical protein [Actinoplanes pyxinae]
MTTTDQDRSISDPVGLITGLVAAADPSLAPDRIQSAVTAVAGGRAKTRRLAAALAARPAVLLDGRSPAPRAVGELLTALRATGTTAISAPSCAGCGKPLQTFTRKGQDWYCNSCEHRRAACAGCGKTKRVKIIDRDGQPRCPQCCDVDQRDPISVIHRVVAELDPRIERETIVSAVNQCCRQGGYQQKLAWACQRRAVTCSRCTRLAPIAAGTLTHPTCADCTPPQPGLTAPPAAAPTTRSPDDANGGG